MATIPAAGCICAGLGNAVATKDYALIVRRK